MVAQPVPSRTILIIEDEPGIVDTLSYALATDGFATLAAGTGRDGLALLGGHLVDLVVLDVGLPDTSGFEVLKGIRAVSQVPVLFLTARVEEIDRVLGLELGADDYVVKPFSPREVVSRIKAILRRSEPRPVSASTQEPRALVIDEECRTVTYFGEKLSLPRYEFDIVRLLAARPGRVFSRDQIMEQVWTDPGESFDRTVDAHIKSIRAKLRAVRPDVDPIATHRGVGYALRGDL